MILKQSTAVDVLIGPFLDLTDAATAETGESPVVKLSKNGLGLAAKNDVTTPVSDADGYYKCELDATDTNAVGTLVLTVAKSATALPVRHEFQVIEEAIYDALYGAAATLQGEIDAITAAVITNAAGADVAADIIAVKAETALIVADTDALQTDWADGGRLDLIQDIIAADTTTDIPALIATAQADLDTITGTAGVLIGTDAANATEISDAVWDEAQSGHVGAGTFGEIATEVASILEDTGTTIPGTITTLQADTDDIQTRLPAALVGGAMDADVSVIQANAITATAIATDAITAAKIAADAIGSSELATTAINTIRDSILADSTAFNGAHIPAIKTETDKLDSAHSEPSGVPAADETPLDKIGFLFARLRNQVTATASKKQYFNDAGTAQWEKDLSDDGTTFTETKGNAP